LKPFEYIGRGKGTTLLRKREGRIRLATSERSLKEGLYTMRRARSRGKRSHFKQERVKGFRKKVKNKRKKGSERQNL